MAKKKLPATLKAWQKCRAKVGVEPFKPMSGSQRSRVEECVRVELKKG